MDESSPDVEMMLAIRDSDVSIIHIDYSCLHPETDPEAIRSDQRQAIIRVLLWAGRSMCAEEISERVWLPVSIVKARLAEIEQARIERREEVIVGFTGVAH